MKAFLVAPTERPPISSMGATSSIPEAHGVDVFWNSPHGPCGAQRKATMDLIASVRDGRLGYELAQMVQLHQAAVIIEGTPQWGMDGRLVTQFAQWSIRQQHGIEMTVQSRGVWVLHTRNPAETVACVEHLWERTQREEKTTSLLNRPGPPKDGWGKLSNRETAIHFMSGIAGLGVELAGRVYDHFGRAPFGLTCEPEELLNVEGIGKKRLEQIVNQLS